ncbi:MAG: type II secretion system protein GspN [Desulfobacterales bacterium]
MMKYIKLIYVFTLSASVLVFLYARFPSENVREYLMTTFIRVLPGYQLQIGDADPAFPIALDMSNVSIFSTNRELATADTVKVGLPISTLFSSHNALRINSKMYGGTVSGTADLADETTGRTVSGEFEVSGIHIDRIPSIQSTIRSNISGTLNGIIVYNSGNPDHFADFTFNLTDTTIPIALSFIRLGDITFNTVDIAGSLANRNLSIGKCAFQGMQMDGELTGGITLSEPFSKSRLNLSGVVTPRHDFLKRLAGNIIPVQKLRQGGVPFTITGTYEQPEVFFR